MTWPYPSPVFMSRQEEGPTWHCPDLTCVCDGGTEGEQELWQLVLFDHRGLRMSRARVRLHLNGRLLSSAPTHAEGDGSIHFELPTAAHRLFVEWAPCHLPMHPRFPYQLPYVLRVARVFPRNFSERLHDLGFVMTPLDEQVRAFQRVYELPVTGVAADIKERLFRCYDLVAVDPVPPPGVPPPGAPPPPALGSSSSFTRDSSSFLGGSAAHAQRGTVPLLAQAPAAPPGGAGLLNQTPPAAAPKPAAPLGRAVDVAGFALTLPELNAAKRIDPTRIRDDFLVPLHWGLVDMWDSTTVAQHPTNSAQWTRL